MTLRTKWNAQRPDVLHIQHAPSFFGMDGRIGELCRLVRRSGVKTAVTLHTVHSARSAAVERLFAYRRCYESLAAHCDAVIVHQRPVAFDSLVSAGVLPSRIEVIPHGTERVELPSSEEVRASMAHAATGPILLAFGFIHPQKNLHTLIAAMYLLARRGLRPRLLVVGSLQNGRWFNQAYLVALRRMVRRFGLQDSVELHVGYVSDQKVLEYFASADLVLLPHWQGYGSASGVLHTALAAHKLVMVSTSPKFADVAHLLGPEFCAPAYSAKRWAQRIESVLASESVQRAATSRLIEYAKSTRWECIAHRTAGLYEKMTMSQGAA